MLIKGPTISDTALTDDNPETEEDQREVQELSEALLKGGATFQDEQPVENPCITRAAKKRTETIKKHEAQRANLLSTLPRRRRRVERRRECQAGWSHHYDLESLQWDEW